MMHTVSVLFIAALIAQGAWRDPSPHNVRFVTVGNGVHLEVLDWGGTGRAVVLLAGSGNTGHVFDEFAPKLKSVARVYAITRRGYGASSQPESGYDDQRLADDVVRVLDVLQIASPVLAGHSMAGGELTTIGRQHSDRIAGLVYLDALGDPRDWPASDPAFVEVMKRVPQAPAPQCREDRTSFAAYRETLRCRLKVAFPESEVRNMVAAAADGTPGEYKTPGWIDRAIGDGQKKRDYANIRVPVLALFEFPRTRLDQLRPDEPQPRNDEERQAILQAGAAFKAFADRWVANLKRAVPDAQLVDLPAAGHFVFITREAEVLAEMRRFLSRLR